jgi:CHASE2 domain-containing sensor protein
MWKQTREIVWRSRSVWIITPSVALSVLVGQWFGLFNLLEWSVRDEWVRLRSRDTLADNLVIVTIDETDIRTVGDWPIPDRSLAQLLQRISAQKPRVIGLDIYRDLPQEPGYQQLVQVFRTTPNLFAVEKISGDRVNPSPVLRQLNQIALADLVLDGDRKVRRALLTAQDAKDGNAIKASLATQVAMKYLEADGITLETIDAAKQKFRLGKTIYQPLNNHDAGYSNADLGGFQVLLNWHGDASAFRTVPMRDVLAGRVPPDLMRDRMVLIGSIASSTNDFFGTPYSSSWIRSQQPTPGVIVHANIAYQLVQGAKQSSTALVGFSGWQLAGWVVLWASIGSGGSWWLSSCKTKKTRQPSSQVFRPRLGSTVLWPTLALSGALLGLSYASFEANLLLPVIPTLVTLVGSAVATSNAYKQQQLVETNRLLEQANDQLRDYSKTLEQKVAQRTEQLATARPLMPPTRPRANFWPT